MQEPDEDLAHLARRYGVARARRVWELSRGATRHFVDTIRRLRIRCDLRPCDSVYYPLTPDHAPALQREYQMRKAAGLGGRWLRAGRGAAPGWARPFGRNPHDGQRAGGSVSGVPGIYPRGGRSRGARPRGLACESHRPLVARRDGRYASRSNYRRLRRHRHRLFDTVLRDAGRTLPPARHLRPRHCDRSRRGSAGRWASRTSCCGIQVGRTTTRGGPAIAACCSAAATGRIAPERRVSAGWRQVSATCASISPLSIRRSRRSRSSTSGRACSRRHPMVCPTSVRTGTIRATCSRWDTAGTG